MIDKESEVYTRIKYAVIDECENVSTTYQSSPKKLPYLYIEQISNEGIVYDLENRESGERSTIELQVYDTGSNTKSKIKNIISLADSEMTNMGYQRFYGFTDKPNLPDSLVSCKVARYRRLICNEDRL